MHIASHKQQENENWNEMHSLKIAENLKTYKKMHHLYEQNHLYKENRFRKREQAIYVKNLQLVCVFNLMKKWNEGHVWVMIVVYNSMCQLEIMYKMLNVGIYIGIVV